MLDGIAASVGPGAFTGRADQRAVAQGLAFGAGLPVVPVSTLEALALQAMRRGAQALACLDARMGEVYWGCFAADAGAAHRRGVGARAVHLLRGAAASPAPYRGIGRGFAAYPELAALAGIWMLRPAPARRCRMRGTWRGSARCGSRRARAWTRRPQCRCICATRWHRPRRKRPRAAWRKVVYAQSRNCHNRPM
jgi:tRNA threonylcarbamoyl adenosine modification protein YeaZ